VLYVLAFFGLRALARKRDATTHSAIAGRQERCDLSSPGQEPLKK